MCRRDCPVRTSANVQSTSALAHRMLAAALSERTIMRTLVPATLPMGRIDCVDRQETVMTRKYPRPVSKAAQGSSRPARPSATSRRVRRGIGPAHAHRQEASRGRHVSRFGIDHVGFASDRCACANPAVPDVDGFIALLEAFRATGGTAPVDIVGRLLEEHRVGNTVSLATLLHSGQVFGFEWHAVLWIPMFQFRADDLVLRGGARRVRGELPATWSEWRRASWFAAPNARLNGRSPADALDSDLAAVLQAARAPKPDKGRQRGIPRIPAIEGSHRDRVEPG